GHAFRDSMIERMRSRRRILLSRQGPDYTDQQQSRQNKCRQSLPIHRSGLCLEGEDSEQRGVPDDSRNAALMNSEGRS
ncbi:MAG: hypothetical protein DWQ29_00005, partial [Planctomycetota bacterium]